MKDGRLTKIIIVGQSSRVKRNQVVSELGIKMETGTSRKGAKKDALNRLGLRRSMRTYFGLR